MNIPLAPTAAAITEEIGSQSGVGARYLVVGLLGPECSERPNRSESTEILCTILHMVFGEHPFHALGE